MSDPIAVPPATRLTVEQVNWLRTRTDTEGMQATARESFQSITVPAMTADEKSDYLRQFVKDSGLKPYISQKPTN